VSLQSRGSRPFQALHHAGDDPTPLSLSAYHSNILQRRGWYRLGYRSEPFLGSGKRRRETETVQPLCSHSEPEAWWAESFGRAEIYPYPSGG
jgi:hypothetical protein